MYASIYRVHGALDIEDVAGAFLVSQPVYPRSSSRNNSTLMDALQSAAPGVAVAGTSEAIIPRYRHDVSGTAGESDREPPIGAAAGSSSVTVVGVHIRVFGANASAVAGGVGVIARGAGARPKGALKPPRATRASRAGPHRISWPRPPRPTA